MAKVIWAPAALEDIDAIAEYIARDSIDRACLLVLRICQAADRLEQFPLFGRVIPELANEFRREIFYGSYRIMYQVNGDEVWITAIVHSARNWNTE